jgi:nitrogen-specific signal transduction histidine kinase
MVRAENLAAVGKAVLEIAHDMKTHLMAIGGFTALVSKKLRSEDPGRKKLAIVIEAPCSKLQGIFDRKER